MKGLNTLLKLYNRNLEEKRKEVVEREKQKDTILEYKKQMREQLQAEHIAATSNPVFAITFAAFEKKIKERMANIDLAVVDLDKKILMLKEEIITLFAEIKKYDILIKKKLLEIEQENKLKEGKALDEIAINGFMRANNDQS